MKSWNKAGKAWLIATALLFSAGASQSWGAAASNSLGEAKCQAALTKSIGKQFAAVAKAMATCKNSVLAGAPGPCPDADAQIAIDKATASAKKTAAKSCQSKCSISSVSCIANQFCPPNGDAPENCTAAGKNFFNSAAMGFPGPFCESLIAGRLEDPAGFGTCAAGLGSIIADELLENAYGDIDGTPALSVGAKACLATIMKEVPKAAGKMSGAVAKCRNAQLTSESPTVLPANCATDDPKTQLAVSGTRQKALDKIGTVCTDTTVDELDLCGAGIGGITTVNDAKTCLGDVLDQVAHSVAVADTRAYAGISIINGAYPATAAARCGDNLANQLPSQFFLLGEECDGTDDSACPDECLPPGDLFECTCGNVPRARSFADGFAADLDNGWTGASHNSKVTDGAGFISDLTNCNCTEFGHSASTAATCIGSTSDSVCNTFAEVQPRCSNRIGDHTSCDGVGNANGAHTDSDCQTCDSYAANAGDYCTGSARFCLAGVNSGLRCNQTSDCPGSTCTATGLCLDGLFAGKGCVGGQNCGVCSGGLNNNGVCGSNANCPGGTCTAHTCVINKTCLEGANDGDPCTSDSGCPGGRCAETSDCSSQCYPDGSDTPTGTCARQSDCAEGERCRGVCDETPTCIKMRNGAPLPLSAKGTSTCIDSQFFTNATGTKDIVTGTHAVFYELRSNVLLSNEQQSVPCPVCGGYCAEEGTGLDYTRCSGTCSGPELECRYGENVGATCTDNTDCGGNLCGGVACRFDDDCPTGTCSGTASPDCNSNDCRIDLSCSGGPNLGRACRIEASTAFGTTSADCPSGGSNVSGQGLAIKWLPLTSGAVTVPNPSACDADGFENYDCNCIKLPPYGSGDATRTQPNDCYATCNGGVNYGDKCSDFTTCVGGAEAGEACDQDADCSGGGSCTGNPRTCGNGDTNGSCSVLTCRNGSNNGTTCRTDTQCTGGGTCGADTCTVGSFTCTNGGECVGPACTTDGDCDGGATCDDVCPSGLCTPLCIGRGKCNGGDRDGGFCAQTKDCPGGGTCDPDDPEEGVCANRSFFHCDGEGWTFVACRELDVDTQLGCELGSDADNPDTSPDQIGAGYCRADVTNCFLNGGAATGAGKGDATIGFSVAAFCIPPSTNGAVNSTAGLPGPGRIRQPTLSVPNFTQLLP